MLNDIITMQLTTPVPVQLIESAIDYNSSLVFLGSCFTENIGSKMNYYGFQACINPVSYTHLTLPTTPYV